MNNVDSFLKEVSCKYASSCQSHKCNCKSCIRNDLALRLTDKFTLNLSNPLFNQKYQDRKGEKK